MNRCLFNALIPFITRLLDGNALTGIACLSSSVVTWYLIRFALPVAIMSPLFSPQNLMAWNI